MTISFFLSFPESPEIVQIFERLAKACFNMMDPKNPNLLNTPLTLVYLMKQLSTKLEGGGKFKLTFFLNDLNWVKAVCLRKYTF